MTGNKMNDEMVLFVCQESQEVSVSRGVDVLDDISRVLCRGRRRCVFDQVFPPRSLL